MSEFQYRAKFKDKDWGNWSNHKNPPEGVAELFEFTGTTTVTYTVNDFGMVVIYEWRKLVEEVEESDTRKLLARTAELLILRARAFTTGDRRDALFEVADVLQRVLEGN